MGYAGAGGVFDSFYIYVAASTQELLQDFDFRGIRMEWVLEISGGLGSCYLVLSWKEEVRGVLKSQLNVGEGREKYF